MDIFYNLKKVLWLCPDFKDYEVEQYSLYRFLKNVEPYIKCENKEYLNGIYDCINIDTIFKDMNYIRIYTRVLEMIDLASLPSEKVFYYTTVRSEKIKLAINKTYGGEHTEQEIMRDFIGMLTKLKLAC